MSISRGSAHKESGKQRVVIGVSRISEVKKPPLKIGVNRHLGAEARKSAFEQEQVAARDAEDKRLLEAAARVTRPTIFTWGPAPRDISSSVSCDAVNLNCKPRQS